jgi:hypothetical protein
MWKRTIAHWKALPPLLRLGFAIVVLAGASDVLYHAAPASWGHVLHVYLGENGSYAHLATLAGMLVSVLGVAIRRPRRAAPSIPHRRPPAG